MSEDFAPLILAVETATRAGSISLLHGRDVISSVSGDANSSHSSDLIQNITRVLEASGSNLKDIDVYAAASGPGSFTGLRIGLATVKALAVSTDRKCVGVSTLAAIARAAGVSPRTVALLPAGRGELYAQMFTVSLERVEALDRPSHLNPSVLLEKYRFENILWAGEGAQAQELTLRDAASARNLTLISNGHRSAESERYGWVIAAKQNHLAEAVGILAFDAHAEGNTISPEDLRATYVRPSDAEIKKDGNDTSHKSSR